MNVLYVLGGSFLLGLVIGGFRLPALWVAGRRQKRRYRERNAQRLAQFDALVESLHGPEFLAKIKEKNNG